MGDLLPMAVTLKLFLVNNDCWPLLLLLLLLLLFHRLVAIFFVVFFSFSVVFSGIHHHHRPIFLAGQQDRRCWSGRLSLFKLPLYIVILSLLDPRLYTYIYKYIYISVKETLA